MLVGVKAFSSFRKGGVTKLYPDNLNHRSYMLVGFEEGLEDIVVVGAGNVGDAVVGSNDGSLRAGRSPSRIH